VGYCVVIRGPLGVGKTTVAKQLARRIGAKYVSIDRVLEDHHLWVSGRLTEFLRANEIAAARARPALASATPVVFDGNFYWKGQIRDLVRRLDAAPFIFTLTAPVRICIARDRRRRPSHGAGAARAVYVRSTAFRSGVAIDATRPPSDVVRDIHTRIEARFAAGQA
jgi:predicted kinase